MTRWISLPESGVKYRKLILAALKPYSPSSLYQQKSDTLDSICLTVLYIPIASKLGQGKGMYLLAP